MTCVSSDGEEVCTCSSISSRHTYVCSWLHKDLWLYVTREVDWLVLLPAVPPPYPLHHLHTSSCSTPHHCPSKHPLLQSPYRSLPVTHPPPPLPLRSFPRSSLLHTPQHAYFQHSLKCIGFVSLHLEPQTLYVKDVRMKHICRFYLTDLLVYFFTLF